MTRFVLAVTLAGCAALWRPALAEPPLLPAPGAAFTPAPDTRCTVARDIGTCQAVVPGDTLFHGVRVEATEFRVRGGHVLAATLRFREAEFDTVLAGLEAVLGPGEIHDEALRAGMGATFPNTVRVWRRFDDAWIAEQYAGSITRSAVTRLSPARLIDWLEERAAQTVRGVRNL